MIGLNSSARLIAINTLFEGQCFLIMANKHERMPQYATTYTGLMMNLVGVAWFYIIPSVRKVEAAIAIQRYNFPRRRLALRNYDYLGLTFSKEIHVKQSTEGFPCLEEDEEIYNEVRLRDITLWCMYDIF